MVATTADLVVNGGAAQALDLCRRLLRTGSSVQCVEMAQLVLERLRSGATGDSSDDVNALLRLLSNYVTPTRELTEEILSLLLFCDHRVLLVHHLPKLTYQSKECVKLVVQAYLELLATDRSLLVPVLGSLAEMPLDSGEKNTVVEATQSLLEAAEESDIPAVVQSLLSMVTKSSASKALGRLRAECNRIQSGTLSLTMEVIGRFASAGSVALTALFRLIRHVEPLTTFDILALTLVMGKSAENESAVRTTTSVAQRGHLHGRLMREVALMLVRPEWSYLLPSFVQFCSCLLATCFRASTRVTLASNLISSSVDSLIVLIETASVVHEEALILLLKIVSQPKKLLLLANTDSVLRARSDVCWNVAEAIALRFSELARRNAGALASSSHLFLDHLHGIASATTIAERYPPHILDLLCSTMALLTKKERGIYSLLMITIQKQLVTRVGAFGLPHDQQSLRLQSSRSLQSRASAVEVKQLMAVLLAGHLLKNQVVVESRDRKTLANWMLRLLASANRDETLLHVMEFVREEMHRSRVVLSALAQERTLLTSAIFQVFGKKGFCWIPRDQVLQRMEGDDSVVIAFDDVTSNVAMGCKRSASPLVADATEFVLKLRFGVLSFSFGNMDHRERAVHHTLLAREYLTKLCLLRELFHCYMGFATPIEQLEIMDAACLLPSAYDQAISAEACGSIEPIVLNTVIWNLVCALDVAVASTNFAAKLYASTANSSSLQHGRKDQYARMAARLHICLRQQDHLAQILSRQKVNISTCLESIDDTVSSQRAKTQKDELEWLLLETSVAGQFLNGELRRIQKEPPRGSLSGLDFRVICLVFEAQLNRPLDTTTLSLFDELELLQVFSQHLHNNAMPSSGFDGASGSGGNLKLLASTREGCCIVKWLCHRAAELSQRISNADYDDMKWSADENCEAVSAEDVAASARTRKSMAYSLAYIYDSFILILEECRVAKAARDSTWAETMMKLLAAGASPGDDLSRVDSPFGYNEVVFRFLARQCLELTDPTLASLVTDALISLVLDTKKRPLVSQLCLALLHQTYPAAPAVYQLDAHAGKFLRDLPLRSLPKAVVSPVSGHVCSLAKYRCASMKWRHVAYLVVGSWAFTADAAAGSLLLAQFLEEMRVLIDAAASDNGEQNGTKRTANTDDSDAESDENDVGPVRDRDEFAVVANGEHIVLKNLTNESLPFFIEAVLLCAIASLHRAIPKKSSAQVLADANPFTDYCSAMNVFGSALEVFAQAEACGFNLPLKTNLLVLRGGAFATRSVRSILTKCIAWRIDQSVSDCTGALEHLGVLFGAARAMSVAMERVTHTFQERVVLKMQRNGRRGGWSNELLAKAYGKRYNTRRLISKPEAKLVPFFAHGIQELQDFLQDQSNVNNIDLEAARAQWESAKNVSGDSEHRDAMLSDEKLVCACRTLQAEEFTAALLKDWRPAVSAESDDDEADEDEDEELAGSQEVDDESLSEDADDGFVVRSDVTTATNRTALLSEHKKLAVGLQENGDLGFPTIVVNFKKQKKTHK